jgi:CHAD domain-containing protein
MAFRLPFDGDLDASIRQTARDELVEAIRLLRDDYPDDPVTAVHEARKNLKKTRALLRLARPGLGSETYRRENWAIRDAARLISGARDADVMQQTLTRLAKRDDARVSVDEFDALRSRLRDEARAPSPPLALAAVGHPSQDTHGADTHGGDSHGGDTEGRGSHGGDEDLEPAPDGAAAADGTPVADSAPAADSAAAAVIEALGAVVERIDDWPLHCEWSSIGQGIARAYRRGRDAFVEADIDPTTERLHDWRKRVKDLWYHQRLLSDAWPEVVGVFSEEAHRLSELLGDDHDLGVLADRVSGADDAAVLEIVGEARAELLRDARRLARRVYAETGAAFTTRIQTYLRCAAAEAARDASV